VLHMLRQAVDRTGQTMVMVTHDPVAASFADSVVFLADGRLADGMAAPSPARIAERMTSLGDW
jgi:putative ABC transport system ATP-binding protein